MPNKSPKPTPTRTDFFSKAAAARLSSPLANKYHERETLLIELQTSLRLFFWGGILCLVDATIQKSSELGYAFRFDIFNDSIGMALFIYGLFKLKKISQEFNIDKLRFFLLFISSAYFLVTIHYHVIYSVPNPLFVTLSLINYCFYSSFLIACFIMIKIFKGLNLRWIAILWCINLCLFIVSILAELIIMYISNFNSTFNLDFFWNVNPIVNTSIFGQSYYFYRPPLVQLIHSVPFIFSLLFLYLSKKNITILANQSPKPTPTRTDFSSEGSGGAA
ncbi:LTA synthase family protein [Desulforegula conservatrix]|uniref:hypothetical protein n=1 Tax=Desulforegula conservatrix TaxID=153026 RepID=UPI00041803EC|nr:hypothetical protein [Desulforegula conservatrix]